MTIVLSGEGAANRFDCADMEALAAYLASDRPEASIFGKGGIIGEYEAELARFHGRRYALLLNSGTSALYAAYFALGIGIGDEVIAPTISFPSTMTPAVRLGASVRLIDVTDGSFNIDNACVETAITPRTKALVFTNMWGYPADVAAIIRTARKHKIAVIEDNSLAMCASDNGLLTGTQADVCCFSLGSTKLLSGGQGGALVTDSRAVYERALLISHFGLRAQQECLDTKNSNYAETGLGLNLRINVLGAVVSASRFQRREELIRARKERFDRLTDVISNIHFLRPPEARPTLDRGIWQGYVATILNDDISFRTNVYKALDAAGIPLKRGLYYKPLHSSALFAQDAANTVFPVADRAYRTAISFPVFRTEPMREIDRYCKSLREVLQGV